MNDVEVFVAKMQTLILEWAKTQNSKNVVPDIAQAILETLENFPFVGSVVEQEFYKRHRAEILGGRFFEGSQQAFLRGLAYLYTLVPYQRRAQPAGLCRVDVAGVTVPTRDWFLNLQILTSGGLQ